MAQQDIQYLFRDMFFSVLTWALIFYALLITGVGVLFWGAMVESITLCVLGICILAGAVFVRVGDTLSEWTFSPSVWRVVSSVVCGVISLMALVVYAPSSVLYFFLAALLCLLAGYFLVKR